MTAKEMFEEEGFEYAENSNMIVYKKKCYNLVAIEIKFHKHLKAMFVSGVRHYVMINCKCFEAILKQYKELGWKNEK